MSVLELNWKVLVLESALGLNEQENEENFIPLPPVVPCLFRGALMPEEFRLSEKFNSVQ